MDKIPLETELAERLLAAGVRHRNEQRRILASVCFGEAMLKDPFLPDAKLALHSLNQDRQLLEELYLCDRDFTPLVEQLDIYSRYRPWGHTVHRMETRADVRRAYALQTARQGHREEALRIMDESDLDVMDYGTIARIATEGGLKYVDVLEDSLARIVNFPDDLAGDIALMTGVLSWMQGDYVNARRHLQSARVLIGYDPGKRECDFYLAKTHVEAEAEREAVLDVPETEDIVDGQTDTEFKAIIEHNFGGRDDWPDSF